MTDKPKVGTILKFEEPRDAVHMAIAPVIAAVPLHPGEHVGFVGLAQHALVSHVNVTDLIGIIDPFLTAEVQPGERCYLFLYPNTVTGLRHEWTHDAFNDNRYYSRPGTSEDEARRWLSLWCLRYNIEYSTLIEAAAAGDYVTAQGVDLHGWEGTSDELALFWQHLETVTHMTFSQPHRENFGFSCSC